MLTVFTANHSHTMYLRSQAPAILSVGGITARAPSRTARLSRLWERWIYRIPERAFSPSPALSATCLETSLHYWWCPGSHYTLSVLRLPPSDPHRYNTCICTHMSAPCMRTERVQLTVSIAMSSSTGTFDFKIIPWITSLMYFYRAQKFCSFLPIFSDTDCHKQGVFPQPPSSPGLWPCGFACVASHSFSLSLCFPLSSGFLWVSLQRFKEEIISFLHISVRDFRNFLFVFKTLNT